MSEELERISCSDLCGSIDGVIQQLTNAKSEYLGKGYTDITISLETEYGYYDDKWEVLVIYGKPKHQNKEK